MDSRFECMKENSCMRCGGCCKIRDMPILDAEEDLKLRKRIYERMGVLYIYNLDRYTISLTHDEKDRLISIAESRGITLKIIPKKIEIYNGTKTIIDWSLDHDTCPFYDEKNRRCSVYESRPSVCESFPREHKFHTRFRKDEKMGFEEAMRLFVEA